MTRIFGCHPDPPQWYTVSQGPKILLELDSFYTLPKNVQPLLQTTVEPPVSRIYIDRAVVYRSVVALRMEEEHQFILQNKVKDVELIVESDELETSFGKKSWRCRLLLSTEVVIKIWDSWKFTNAIRDHEVEVYLRLQIL